MTSISTVLAHIKELPTLPEIYVKVSAMLDDEHSTAWDIGEAIKTDPSITSRILKVVNSAFYGMRQEITSIPQALTLLGRIQIKNILVGTVLSRVFSQNYGEHFSLEEFWRHSIKTAIIARHLGMQNAQVIDHEALFTAGLLHDIGRLVIANALPGDYDEVMLRNTQQGEEIIQIETEVLGFDHTQVGELLLESWEFPELLISCVRYHHHETHSGTFALDRSIVYLANQMTQHTTPITDARAASVIESIKNWDESGCTMDQTYTAWKLADEQVSEVLESFGMLN